MKVKQTLRFVKELNEIYDFIAQYNEQRASLFNKELLDKLHNLGDSPFKCRQSKTSDDKNIRDFIFKSYVVPYLVDMDNDIIVILGIFKSNIWK